MLAGYGGRDKHLRLSVTPSTGLVPTPFRVQAAGAAPGAQVTIAVRARSRQGRMWSAVRTLAANCDGRVDWQRAYLVALLHPQRPRPADDSLPRPTGLTITARSGGATATARAWRIARPASVSVREERPAATRFYGHWFIPRGTRRHTAVLLLGGSEGGLPAPVIASTLAAHGYPTLALAYFGVPGLPRRLERIPLEYFHRALTWMREQPEVDPRRIVTFGISRGGELSLLLASTFRDLVHGAVGYVPSSTVNPGFPNFSLPAWTYRGQPVLGDIPLQRISGPVFAVGGGDDKIWPSDLYVGNIQFALRGRDPRDVELVYPHAGHYAGGVLPNQAELSTDVVSPRYGLLHLGGTPAADEAAREDSWPKLLRFLNRI